jgi:hypothetical protein
MKICPFILPMPVALIQSRKCTAGNTAPRRKLLFGKAEQRAAANILH